VRRVTGLARWHVRCTASLDRAAESRAAVEESRMQIQVNHDDHVRGAKFVDFVEAEVRSALDRFGERITRVEVHLSDANAQKGGGADARCLMEVRIVGQNPLAVTGFASSVGQAIAVAAEKLERLVEHTIGRLDDSTYRKGPDLPPDSGPPLPGERS
jgi:hypothetical protein